MKNAKTIQLAKQEKAATLFMENGIQWVRLRGAEIPLAGVPELTEDQFVALADVKDKSKMIVTLGHGVPERMRDTVDGEELADPIGVKILYQGTALIPIRSKSGVCFIDAKYLLPYSDIENGVQLYVRKEGGGKRMIAVKTGFLYVGSIAEYFPGELIEKLTAVVGAAG